MMLYSLEQDSIVTRIPHNANYWRWRNRLSQAEYQSIVEFLNSKLSRAFPIPQIQMLHPNNPAHFFEELFSHDENPNRINSIKAVLGSNGNRKMDSLGVGKSERNAPKMPHIAKVWKVLSPKISNLRSITGREAGIKKRVARIFDKKSYCHRLYS